MILVSRVSAVNLVYDPLHHAFPFEIWFPELRTTEHSIEFGRGNARGDIESQSGRF